MVIDTGTFSTAVTWPYLFVVIFGTVNEPDPEYPETFTAVPFVTEALTSACLAS
jgi:hypothetical protein